MQTVSLPKLPVPDLQQTLEKYEKTLQPLLDEDGKQRVRAMVARFGGEGGLGRRLQLYLLARQEKLDNWVRCMQSQKT